MWGKEWKILESNFKNVDEVDQRMEIENTGSVSYKLDAQIYVLGRLSCRIVPHL